MGVSFRKENGWRWLTDLTEGPAEWRATSSTIGCLYHWNPLSEITIDDNIPGLEKQEHSRSLSCNLQWAISWYEFLFFEHAPKLQSNYVKFMIFPPFSQHFPCFFPAFPHKKVAISGRQARCAVWVAQYVVPSARGRGLDQRMCLDSVDSTDPPVDL